MTSERILLAGTVDEQTGRVSARPVVAVMAADGSVASWQPLGSHETHSTVFRPLLLELPSLRLRPISGQAE